MKNKKLVLLSLGLLLIVTTLVVSIAAWLTDTKEFKNTTFTVGKVQYTFVGEFITKDTNERIVPGEELIHNSLTLTNKSTVISELRVKVILEIDEVVTELDDVLSTNQSINGGFNLDTGWEKNEDGFWYFRNSSTSGEPGIIPIEDTSIPLLSHLMLDGSKVGNSYGGKTVIITFVFQAKQAEYVGWSDLGEIDFEIGL